METGSLTKCGVRFRRINERFRDSDLILNGEAKDFVVFNRFLRGFTGCAYNEIRQATALDFSSTLQQGENV